MRMQFTILALALGLVACQGESSAAPPASNFMFTVAGPREGQRPPAGFEGTWIDIAPGVQYRQTLVMSPGVELSKETWLNGHPFTVEDGWVVIGPERYGPIAQGAHVEITQDGVFADGAKLGDLPERRPLPPDGD